ncbi:MAG: type II secretion system F family protein [Deltaproteobacteria bacterium]|nr:type II secretion system F family protein [Deltaproteobacteria bacterium]
MFDMPFMISALVFMGVLLFITATYSLVKTSEEHRHVIRKLKFGILTRTNPDDTGLSVMERLGKHFIGGITRLGDLARPKGENEASRIERDLWHAGFRAKNATIFYFGAKVFLAILLPSLVIVSQAYAYRIKVAVLIVPIIVISFFIGFYLPDLYMRFRVRRRKRRILEGFPDALDLMVVCVEAGMGLDQALNRVTEEMKMTNKPLYEEFRQLILELRAGKSRRDALRSLAQRMDLEDVNSLVTLLIQTDRFGTSIAQALRVHSDGMRTRRHQRAEEMAAKLPVKLLFPLIMFVFPSLFVAILGPTLIQVFRLWSGWSAH